MLPASVKSLVKRRQSKSKIDITDFKPTTELQYEYSRPSLLGTLSQTAQEIISNSNSRVVVCPIKPTSLPGAAGYAEVVNAGKSKTSEDQAVCIQDSITSDIKYTLFAVYDGHGGNGTSLKVSKELHLVIHQSLADMESELKDALQREKNGIPEDTDDDEEDLEKACSAPYLASSEELISGALESSLWVMDSIILHDKSSFKITGGSTVLIVFIIFNKIWIVNCGDSRAVMFREKSSYKPEPLSFDYTPESDRRRIQEIAYHKPELLTDNRSGERIFSRLQFSRKLSKKDIGKQVKYRDFYMSGWGLKEVTEEDVELIPLISGRGKGVRLMLTMGVSRSLGDFDLIHRASMLNMKDFLTPQPEVRIWRPEEHAIGDKDVIVMGTDGLWDVVSNQEASTMIKTGMIDESGDLVWTQLARGLVERARGERKDGFWDKIDGRLASGDDITVFVIPITKFLKKT